MTALQPSATEARTNPREGYEKPSLTCHGSLAVQTGNLGLSLNPDQFIGTLPLS
ncbi:hypothetical protein [Pseudofrankia asymbiotica]|uniref:hypothetical protein n=1 Tax=Pseudofrankia asymbiotica TaxID=1834516 RepID=UPI001303F9D2|nr:hypothetical protein [Pseudofrankia asymbiotica]